MKELNKWSLRLGGYGLLLTGAVCLLVGLMSYKARLVLLGVGLSEALWLVWFRPVYGKTEEKTGVDLLALLILRAALLLVCVLGITLGL